MKKILCIFAAAVLLCTLSLPVFACTGFAVYPEAGKAYYGANFDYSPTECTLWVDEYEGKHVLVLAFNVQGNWIGQAVYNEDGLLTLVQELYTGPYRTTQLNDTTTEDLGDWTRFLPYFVNTVQAVRDNAAKTPVGLGRYGRIHGFFADPTDAMVLEVQEDGLYKMDLPEKFLITTNFPNAQLDPQNLSAAPAHAIGGDRYESIYAFLQNSGDKITPELCMQALEGAAQHTAQFETLSSMVYAPFENAVYLCVARNYNQVWKLSLQDGTVSTWQGFSKQASFSLMANDGGVMLSDLTAYAQNNAAGPLSGLTFILPLAALGLAAVTAGFLVWRHRRKQYKNDSPSSL